jgi:hypothetical protein
MAGSGPDLAAAYCCTNRSLDISNSSCNFVFSSTLSKYTASYPKQLLHVLRGHPFGKEPELLLAEAQLDGLVTSSGFGLQVSRPRDALVHFSWRGFIAYKWPAQIFVYGSGPSPDRCDYPRISARDGRVGPIFEKELRYPIELAELQVLELVKYAPDQVDFEDIFLKIALPKRGPSLKPRGLHVSHVR